MTALSFVWLWSLDVWAFVATVLGAGISTYTLIKVRSIARAKSEERELLARALKLRDLTRSLATSESLLDSADPSSVAKVKTDLIRLRSEFEAAIRILIPKSAEIKLLEDVEVLAEGYWTDVFAENIVNSVRRSLIIVTWRNTRCFSEQLLEALIGLIKLNRNLTIKIFYVSPDAPDNVYYDMSLMLRIGDAASIKAQQILQRNIACAAIAAAQRSGRLNAQDITRLQFFEYRGTPQFHCIIADDEVNWGINFYADEGIGATELLNRAYMKSSTTSLFGIKVLEQVAILEGMSTRFNVPGLAIENSPGLLLEDKSADRPNLPTTT